MLELISFLSNINGGLYEAIGTAAFLATTTGVMLKSCKSKVENKICNYKEIVEKNPDGIYISEHVRLTRQQSCEHIMMLAPSGMGKSHKFYAHNLQKLTNCSIILNDPSGEMRKYSNFKNTVVFNPLDKNSIHFDPLENCSTEFDVNKLSSIIIESGMCSDGGGDQKQWVEMAKPLIASYFLFNWYTKKYSFAQCMENLMTHPLKTRTNEKGEPVGEIGIAEEICRSGVKPAILKYKAFFKTCESPATLASIYTVMNSCLQVFLDSSVKKITSGNNYDISRLRREETCLIIEIPDRHIKYFQPLINVLINQLFDKLFEIPGLQVYFFIDEFGNIKIDDAKGVLSTARKKKIGIVAAIQNNYMIQDIYAGKYKAILEAFATLVIGAGLRDTANYLSDLIGEHIEEKHKKTEKLMTSSDIRTMSREQLLIISSNKRVVKDNMLSYI